MICPFRSTCFLNLPEFNLMGLIHAPHNENENTYAKVTVEQGGARAVLGLGKDNPGPRSRRPLVAALVVAWW